VDRESPNKSGVASAWAMHDEATCLPCQLKLGECQRSGPGRAGIRVILASGVTSLL
jgi:hypothetical protein